MRIVDAEPHRDYRASFSCWFCADDFAQYGLKSTVAQTSISFNYTRDTSYGLQRQMPPYAGAKLVRCTRGAIADVAVDVPPRVAVPTARMPPVWVVGAELSYDTSFPEPDTLRLLEPTDSPIVGNALVVRAPEGYVGAGSQRSIAGASLAEAAAITSFATPDSDALAALLTIPGALRARWQQRYSTWLAASDVIVVIGVVAVAHILRFGTVTSGSLWAGYASAAYSAVSVLIVSAWVLVLAHYHTRAQQVIGAGPEEFRRVWTATLWVFGIIAVFSTLFKLEIARGYLAIAFPLGLLALSVNRHLARIYVAAQRRRGRFMTAVLAVGEPYRSRPSRSR